MIYFIKIVETGFDKFEHSKYLSSFVNQLYYNWVFNKKICHQTAILGGVWSYKNALA